MELGNSIAGRSHKSWQCHRLPVEFIARDTQFSLPITLLNPPLCSSSASNTSLHSLNVSIINASNALVDAEGGGVKCFYSLHCCLGAALPRTAPQGNISINGVDISSPPGILEREIHFICAQLILKVE